MQVRLLLLAHFDAGLRTYCFMQKVRVQILWAKKITCATYIVENCMQEKKLTRFPFDTIYLWSGHD